MNEKPEPYFRAQVLVERVTPEYLSKERYNSTSPLRVEQQDDELISITHRSDDELEAIEAVLAYLEVRRDMVIETREAAAAATKEAEAVRQADKVDTVPLPRRPLEDAPQA